MLYNKPNHLSENNELQVYIQIRLLSDVRNCNEMKGREKPHTRQMQGNYE
jgi:hypothetical protein